MKIEIFDWNVIDIDPRIILKTTLHPLYNIILVQYNFLFITTLTFFQSIYYEHFNNNDDTNKLVIIYSD